MKASLWPPFISGPLDQHPLLPACLPCLRDTLSGKRQPTKSAVSRDDDDAHMYFKTNGNGMTAATTNHPEQQKALHSLGWMDSYTINTCVLRVAMVGENFNCDGTGFWYALLLIITLVSYCKTAISQIQLTHTNLHFKGLNRALVGKRKIAQENCICPSFLRKCLHLQVTNRVP